ncbi:MAG: phosphoheptose isomerase [Cryomorphaceae bacterium]|nr:phosphoheptose isomerase [Cryomorphaceae bacterium]
MSKEAIKKHFDEAAEVLSTFNNATNIEAIHSGLLVMVEALRNGNKLISCGNGGSMSDAMHFAEELTGRFRNERKALSAVSISDPTHISCVANDYGYEFIFSRYVEAMGNEGDILLGISTSGNSKNVINAIEAAKRKGMKTVVLTGKTGGILSNIADIEIRAPHSEFADRAQEIHIKVIHALIDGIERALKLS